MLQSILFTHNDMDGYGCKLIFELVESFLGHDYKVVVCSNNKVDNDVLSYIAAVPYYEIGKDTHFYFSDIVPSLNVLVNVANLLRDGTIGGVTICDHHVTNLWAKDIIEDATVVPTNDLGIMESGTSLMYKHFAETIRTMEDGGKYNYRLLAELVDKIRSYDTYEWKTTKDVDAKKLNILFNMVGGDNFLSKYMERIMDANSSEELIDANDMIFVDCKYKYEQQVIDSITIDDVVSAHIRGYRVALMLKSIPANVSEVAYQFLEKHPEFDAFASMSLFNGGEFSFRTQREDLNVGEVFAAPIGGGGHPKAAGAKLPDFIKDALQDICIQWLNGNDVNISVANTYHEM